MAKETSPRMRQTLLGGMVMGSTLGAILFVAPTEIIVLRTSTVLAQTNDGEFDTVSGRLDQVNVAEKKGTLTTDIGKQVAFQITRPELFMNLSPGQRVTLKLDKQGRAVRVMETAAPELPPPPSGPR